MATSNPLEEILSSAVDESAINALVGTLESQLSSPGPKQLVQQVSNSPSVPNHVSSGIISKNSSPHAVDQKPPVLVSGSAGPTPINTQNGPKLGTQGLPASSLVLSGSDTFHNMQNTRQEVITDRKPNINVIANATPTVTLQTVKSESPIPRNVPVTHLTVNVNGQSTASASNITNIGASAHSLNVLRDHKPAIVSGHLGSNLKVSHLVSTANSSNTVTQLDNKQNVQVINSGASDSKQFVIKTEPGVSTIKPHIKQEPNVRSTKSPVLHVLNASKTSAATPVSTSVITITKQMTNPQTVTVVKPSTGVPHTGVPGAPIQVVNVNTPSRPSVSQSVHQKSLAPRMVNQPIRIAAGQGSVTLPPGIQLPPGCMIMKNEQGHIVVLQGQTPGGVVHTQSGTNVLPANYKVQTVKSGTPQGVIRPGNQAATVVRPGGTTTHTVIQGAVTSTHTTATPIRPAVAVPAQGTVADSSSGSSQVHMNMPVEENVKKCKNFLSTLISLAAKQPADTVRKVKALIQGLIDGSIEAEQFTSMLQVELKSSPQPYLVPFLRKSLPLLRTSLQRREMIIEGVNIPASNHSTTSSAGQNKAVLNPMTAAAPGSKLAKATPQQLQLLRQAQIQQLVAQGKIPANQKVILQSKSVSPAQVSSTSPKVSTPQHKEKRKYDALKEDDDINDVAAMGGVNLTEESRNILGSSDVLSSKMRSCKDENFLSGGPLQSRINAIAKKHGLEDTSQEVVNLISHSTQERLRNILERLSLIAEHRLEMYKTDHKYVCSQEVKGQIKFIEELDKLEKKRHEEQEREVLLRAVKSRSKNEDPEQLKLKQKAKEMQQAEMDEIRQREANETALLAIGPRKKRKGEADSPGPGSSGLASSTGSAASSSRSSVMFRPRIKRVNLRDLVFLMEQERESGKSLVLYKSFLK